MAHTEQIHYQRIMCDGEHAHTVVTHLTQQLNELDKRGPILTKRRFIRNHHIGMGGQHGRDREPTFLTARQGKRIRLG